MPYRDREEQLAYLREYSRQYAEDHRQKIKTRRAAWFQGRKETAAILQRIRRTMARCEPGFRALEAAERECARAAVSAVAASPDLPRAVQAGLWVGVSAEGRRRFLRALDSKREITRWADVLDLPADF